MWTKLKLGLLALGSFALAVLWFLLGRANDRADKAERKVAAHEGVREVENNVAVANRQAEEKANEELARVQQDALAGRRDHFD